MSSNIVACVALSLLFMGQLALMTAPFVSPRAQFCARLVHGAGRRGVALIRGLQ
jgi:hypothetical protein